MVVETPICNFGWKAPAFELPGTDGELHRLEELRGERATLIIFICNHCPYVRSVIDRIVRDVAALAPLGVGVAAICSNDAASHPDDSFDNMVGFAADNGFNFPYLHDASQQVARAYDAVCTPDFFGFNDALELRYRGRLDESGRLPAEPGARRELYEAIARIAETGEGPAQQVPSMGCSIKWTAA